MSSQSIIFKAKNLFGDVKEISYISVSDIPLFLTQEFGYTPLYEPIWIDQDGNEQFPPKNNETVFILFKYVNIPVLFVHDWSCIEEDTGIVYEEYTLVIESDKMQYVYEEVVLSFFYAKGIYYSETARINIVDEDYGGLIKYIIIPDETPYFTSIKELVLSFKDSFNNIPEDFFNHLAECVENSWVRHGRKVM